jgi:lipoprotein-anchoring transpeptidase ErfK/SrfK
VIHVDVAHTWLYLALVPSWARRYNIAVGAAGRNLGGQARVGRKAEWPSWSPTASMIAAEPEVYGPMAGAMWAATT